MRWSVQACREFAFETQVWGKSKTKGVQEGAILADSYNVLLVVDSLKSSGRGYKAENRGKTYYAQAHKVLLSPEQINDWIELNRTRRRARTAKLAVEDRKICDRATHAKAMRIRYKAAGMAKGGWLGAGMDIARAQTGQDRINIGKNFLGYAQKHSHFGSSIKPREGWSPASYLTNRVGHSGNSHVLKSGASKKAIEFGLSKTVKWYASALRAIDKKRKP